MMATLDDLKTGGKRALSQALAEIEARPYDEDVVALLDEAWASPVAHVLGLTGPPGVGKSTLINALIRSFRKAEYSVGVVAIDPSSSRTGGALLGDRTRFITNPDDKGIFIRSLAARDRLGGLAALAFPAMVLMRALYDRVIVETVGVGQSETDVARIADTAIFCIQPASGDSVQFMKAGIMEVPDIFAVSKADLGSAAERARADLEGALSLATTDHVGWQPAVLALSAARGTGIDDLIAACDAHRQALSEAGLVRRRGAQAAEWLEGELLIEVGRRGLQQVGDFKVERPFAALADMLAR